MMRKAQGDSQSDQQHKGNILQQVKNLMASVLPNQHPSMSSISHFTVEMGKIPYTPNTRTTLMAFVDAVIPSTLGALDLRLDDYLMWSLDHLISIQGEWGVKTIPLSAPTAEILDAAAIKLLHSGDIKRSPNSSTFSDGGPFAALSQKDRFEAIHMLENLQVDLQILPPPYRNNIGLVKFIISNLHQMVMMGYYSEWFSFGSTRLAPPEDRFPRNQNITWHLVDYPGPSVGYRAHRGFLIDRFYD